MKVYKLELDDYSPLIVEDINDGLSILGAEIENDPDFDEHLTPGNVILAPFEKTFNVKITILEMTESAYQDLPEWEP